MEEKCENCKYFLLDNFEEYDGRCRPCDRASTDLRIEVRDFISDREIAMQEGSEEKLMALIESRIRAMADSIVEKASVANLIRRNHE